MHSSSIDYLCNDLFQCLWNCVSICFGVCIIALDIYIRYICHIVIQHIYSFTVLLYLLY